MATDTPSSTAEAPSRHVPDSESITTSTARPIEELLDRLGPDAAFGKPVEADGVTVISVAEVGSASAKAATGPPKQPATTRAEVVEAVPAPALRPEGTSVSPAERSITSRLSTFALLHWPGWH